MSESNKHASFFPVINRKRPYITKKGRKAEEEYMSHSCWITITDSLEYMVLENDMGLSQIRTSPEWEVRDTSLHVSWQGIWQSAAFKNKFAWYSPVLVPVSHN
ncbi:Parkinson disease 7 domain-containing protein 1 [Platysternon megacephalum]|uniref:Parkinson disease 7 domain-containing protein 1 n=1 Tax=Platysternon megacephalum TaxID=55544 RepID=A0A4D9E6G9_9SAUR|nr:Parkinson disease 7 domain-containing protein 1 [Platysternon megacephalum]